MDSNRFFAEMRGKRVAVIGIGVSNTELSKLLARQGAPVTVCDRRTRDQIEAATELEAAGCALRLGENYLENLNAEVVFRTPGMYFYHPALTALRERGAAVTSEMEVFFDLCPCKTIAVTGSDGKTTTTTLIAEMLRAQGRTVHLGGNLGRALLPEVFAMRPEDVAVVELSSFQLISMRRSPDVAVITNVTPNHLDVHGSMEEYIGAKRNLYLHQNAFSATVLGADNDIAASFAPEVRGRLRWFSLERPVENGAYLGEDGVLRYVCNGEVEALFPASDIRLPGMHNVANYLAAIAAVRDVVDAESIHEVARTFGGVEHRIELVREVDGVKWYNDSIATSPSRAIAGLKSFRQKLVVIAGGYDKKIPFEPLAPHVVERVRLLILTGDTADQIEAAVTAHPDYRPGSPEILRAESLEDAVRVAREKTCPGDVVSLSPACASFDRYPNFEARGRHFKELVNALESSAPDSGA